MSCFPIFLFWLLASLFVSDVLSSASALPERVATHFGSGGIPNGWMSREGHVQFILILGLGLSFFVVGIHYLLARYGGNQFNIPHREYWLASERRAETMRFMVCHSWWLGCLMVVFIWAIHRLLLIANLSSPPRLPTVPFLLLIAAFLIALGRWIFVLRTRFRKMP